MKMEKNNSEEIYLPSQRKITHARNLCTLSGKENGILHQDDLSRITEL